MADNDYGEIFAAYSGIEPVYFNLEYGISTIPPALQGATASEGALNILRAFGHNVILTPDDCIIEITEAPAIELPGGRKYKADGTVY